jgi:hypothetical protein
VPGFGSGPFGSGPFGRFDWSKQVLYRDLPPEDRRLDQLPENNNRLEKFSDSIRPSFDYLLKKASDFPSLRDPDTVPTRFNGLIPVTITAVDAEASEQTINVTLNAPDPSDPFDPLGDSTIGWVLEDDNGRQFTVNSIQKLDADGSVVPVVEVFGINEPPVVGAATLRPPSLIELLGADFGIQVDQNEPESFQRSSVRNVTQWLDLKGTAKAYDIIGKIAGYRITARGLWRLPSVIPSAVPAANLFEIPTGSGKWYSDLAPTRPSFDDVVADAIPLDLFCYEEPTWSTDFPSGPPMPLPADGTSVSEAIGIQVRAVPIISSTDLGDGRWSIRIGPTDLTEVMVVDEAEGNWYVQFPGGDSGDFFIESVPTEPSSGEWEFEILVGDSPTFGGTVDLRYDCQIDVTCDYCRASVLRFDVVPAEVITNPDALLEGVLGRLTSKILQVTPAHVRFTQISLNIGPIVAAFSITADIATASTATVSAGVGYYFDSTDADVITLDPDHMVASVTAFTIP